MKEFLRGPGTSTRPGLPGDRHLRAPAEDRHPSSGLRTAWPGAAARALPWNHTGCSIRTGVPVMTSNEKLQETLLELGTSTGRRTRAEQIEEAMRLALMLMDADAVTVLPPASTGG